jgi:hypothetical protein
MPIEAEAEAEAEGATDAWPATPSHAAVRVKVNEEISTLGSPLYSDANACLAGRPSAPVLRLISAA